MYVRVFVCYLVRNVIYAVTLWKVKILYWILVREFIITVTLASLMAYLIFQGFKSKEMDHI